MGYTKEQIEAVYGEVSRRLTQMVENEDFEDDFDRKEYQKAMLQGVYSALIATATNWPEAAKWCCEAEEKLGW